MKCWGENSMSSSITNFKLKKDRILQIEMEVVGASAELYFNGLPVRYKTKKERGLISVPAMLYLVDHVNTIELVVGPGPIPSQARTGPNTDDSKPEKAIARLVEYPPGVFPGDPAGNVITEATLQDFNVKLPHTIKACANMEKFFGEWQWQKEAETLHLDAKLTKEVTQFVEKAYLAYKNGNTEYLTKIARIFFIEGAKAHHHISGDTAIGNMSDFSKNLKELIKKDYWKFSGLDPAQFDFRIVANGKMLECIDKKWQPIVKSDEIDEMSYPFPMLVSRINGKLEVVR
jgi:hypothetical protein